MAKSDGCSFQFLFFCGVLFLLGLTFHRPTQAMHPYTLLQKVNEERDRVHKAAMKDLAEEREALERIKRQFAEARANTEADEELQEKILGLARILGLPIGWLAALPEAEQNTETTLQDVETSVRGLIEDNGALTHQLQVVTIGNASLAKALEALQVLTTPPISEEMKKLGVFFSQGKDAAPEKAATE